MWTCVPTLLALPRALGSAALPLVHLTQGVCAERDPATEGFVFQQVGAQGQP